MRSHVVGWENCISAGQVVQPRLGQAGLQSIMGGVAWQHMLNWMMHDFASCDMHRHQRQVMEPHLGWAGLLRPGWVLVMHLHIKPQLAAAVVPHVRLRPAPLPAASPPSSCPAPPGCLPGCGRSRTRCATPDQGPRTRHVQHTHCMCVLPTVGAAAVTRAATWTEGLSASPVWWRPRSGPRQQQAGRCPSAGWLPASKTAPQPPPTNHQPPTTNQPLT